MRNTIPDSIKFPDLELHERYVDHFGLLDKCTSLYDHIADAFETRRMKEGDVSLYQIALLSTYIKVNNSLRSLSSLCSRGFTEDARTMARKVLEATVSMAYISLDPEKRTGQYWHHGVIRGYLKAKEIVKDNSYSDLVRKRYQELLPKYEARYHKNKGLYECKANGEVKPTFRYAWSGKNLMKMAKECGLGDLQVCYDLFCESTHTSVADIPTYFSMKDAEFSPGMDAGEVPYLTLTGVQLITIMSRLINTSFSLSLETVIEEIEAETRRLDGDLVKGNRSVDE